LKPSTTIAPDPARSTRAGSRSIVQPAVTERQPLVESKPIAAARSRAEQRLHRQRETLRPLGLAVILIVVIGSANSHPAPGVHGKPLAVTLALCAFGSMLAVAIRDRFPDRRLAVQAGVIAAMGAGGVALAGLQPRGATQIGAGLAVFMAMARLPLPAGVALAAAVTVALDVVIALAGSSSTAVVGATLVTVVFGLVAAFLKQAREGQDRTEVLLAQLQDAREQQTRAAAVAERGRIASELHDVLAHSLSAAAIQLQGARVLADREQAESQLSAAIDRASELVKAGLVNARQAVGALRGEALPGLEQLDSLINSYRADMNVDVTLRIEGELRTLPADTSLALYRGVQEALTNIARYAPNASATVVLGYERHRTTLSVDNGVSVAQRHEGLGGGHGLSGMRQRIERAGGTMSAGPTAEGWRVELEVPA
jgi:signal transduction histidine kinase